MLLVSNKMVFIGNEAALLRVNMLELAKAFAATIKCVTFWNSFCHYKVQFSWRFFQKDFGMGARRSS